MPHERCNAIGIKIKNVVVAETEITVKTKKTTGRVRKTQIEIGKCKEEKA